MKNTKLNYLEDSYLFQSSSKFVKIENLESGETALVLEEAIFYPQGGGQKGDRGEVKSESGNFKVVNTKFDPGLVYHVGNFESGRFSEGEEVTLFVDRDFRILNMKLHTAGHLIDSAIRNLGPRFGFDLLPVRGFHFPEGPYVAFRGQVDSEIKGEYLLAVEEEVNRMIGEGFETQVKIVAKGELAEMCDFVPDYLPEGKPIRAVLVWADHWIPCGGTHVKNISEIGKTKIRGIKTKKGNTKVSYELG